MKKINEIVVDERFETFVLIKEMQIRTSKTGKIYQQFKFRDKSGEINGFLWDVNDYTKNNFTAGTVVAIKGRKELYQNMTQFNQISLRKPVEGEPNDPADFEQTPELSAEDLNREISRFVEEKIEPGIWQTVVKSLIEKHKEAFYSYPAAKTNHHDYPTGLSYHTFTMLQVAEKLSEVYPILNTSLLYSGIILHDLGKVLEFSGATQVEYTTTGNLIGHIILIDEEIIKISKELNLDADSEELVVLRHLVLSHHGKLEYGSPVQPKVLEAEILHVVDKLDADMMMMTNALALVSPGEQTARIVPMGGRNFYKPKLS